MAAAIERIDRGLMQKQDRLFLVATLSGRRTVVQIKPPVFPLRMHIRHSRLRGKSDIVKTSGLGKRGC